MAKMPLFLNINLMKIPASLLLAPILAGALPSHAAEVFYPTPGLVNSSTGFMESKVGGDWYRGSAVVARDPKLIYSCAHLYFEKGKWATNYLFHRAYHGKSYPATRNGVSPRGLHYFTSYSSGVKTYGSDSEVAFASDFTVLYGNSSFGPAVGWWPKGGPALRSSQPKRIVGYPSYLDFTGESGHVFQHATGWFDYRAFRVYGGYHEFDDVSTGPGNSGGPIFIQDNTGREDLAGILVAGTRRSAGVVALDLSTDTMAGYALGLKDQTRTFQNSKSVRLPDGGKSFTTVPIAVSGFSGSIAKLKLSLSIDTATRSNLDVYLVSPSGRVRWISKRAGGSEDDLEIDLLDLTNPFYGLEANGTWQLRIRDAVSGSPSTFQRASLRVSAL